LFSISLLCDNVCMFRRGGDQLAVAVYLSSLGQFEPLGGPLE
jgi:hypothetical protein